MAVAQNVWHGSSELESMLVKIDDLRNDPGNVKVHKERDLGAIAASLREFGQAKPIVALHEGTVIAGNGTLLAAKRLGWTHVAVAHFEDETKARAYAIADNRTSELSIWDESQLAQTLEELQRSGSIDMEALGYNEDEMASLISGLLPTETADVNTDGRDPDDKITQTPGGIPSGSSHVRMVQLFFTDETHPVFVERAKALSKKYGTENITDTVFEAMKILTADD